VNPKGGNVAKKNGSTPKKRILATKTNELPCPLTEPELREAGKRLAHLEGDLAAQTAREKDVKDDLKSKRSALEMQISMLANTIRAGLVYRPTPVRVEADYEENVVREIREDTGETVSTRPVNEQDRQATLFPGGPTDDKKAAPPQLCWGMEGVNYTAATSGGTYAVEEATDGFRVYWTPAKGRSQKLGTAETSAEGRDLAERHYIAQAADAILENAGDGKLAGREAR
jgi:hypothetical protein